MTEAEDLVRDVFSRWNEGEREFDDAVFEESLTIHSALTGDMYEGPDGVQAWAAEIDDQFKDWNLVLEETQTLDDGSVLARGEIHMTGRQSEVAIEQPASWVIEFESGLISSVRNFVGRDTAEKFTRSER